MIRIIPLGSRRDNGEKQSLSRDELINIIPDLLHEIQDGLFKQAKAFRSENSHSVSSYDEFKERIKEGGFVKCGWDGDPDSEQAVKEETKATIRCIPFDEEPSGLNCIYSGRPAKHEVIYAKAY